MSFSLIFPLSTLLTEAHIGSTCHPLRIASSATSEMLSVSWSRATRHPIRRSFMALDNDTSRRCPQAIDTICAFGSASLKSSIIFANRERRKRTLPLEMDSHGYFKNRLTMLGVVSTWTFQTVEKVHYYSIASITARFIEATAGIGVFMYKIADWMLQTFRRQDRESFWR